MQEITNNISFAPIGLLDMFNSSGAVEQFDTHLVSDKNPELFDGEAASNVPRLLSENRSPTATITLKVRGCSRFGAYSSQRPLKCRLDNVETEFNYDITSGLLTLSIRPRRGDVRQRENEDVISAGACKEEAVRACIVLHHPKMTIAENIKPTISKTDSAKKFIEFVQSISQSGTADKTVAGMLMGTSTTMIFDGSRTMHEHVTEITNITTKLESVGLKVNESFFVTFIMNSLPPQYGPFQINSDTINDKRNVT
ncbi:hypothetical protein RJ641_026402 [Dillenia turbinata]|uniref:Uncharacterized protein n=1 Tax=Dillenia turbinata TaxID=194707 RepID=A0AAN8ZU32_9MAGN